MQHQISQQKLQSKFGIQAKAMIASVEACVHCGFCLASCPTYQVLQEEMDSPRGRIVLMKSALEGNLPIADTLPFIDRCLGCLACVSSCPSGVRYDELLFPFRNNARKESKDSLTRTISRRITQNTLPYPKRFHNLANLGIKARSFSFLLPKEMQSMLALLPEKLPESIQIPEITPARGKKRGRIALLRGCAQQSLSPEINKVSVDVLSRNGIEVVIIPEQACCGAILYHSGDLEGARNLARKNLIAFEGVIRGEYDAVITNAAGCGAGLKEYPHWFAGLPEQEKSENFSKKVKDITVFLYELGLIPPPPLPVPLKVAYHDACHLSHAQGVIQPPRQLLMAISNLTLLPISQSEICCGSAGTYNIDQPAIASELGKRKIDNIILTGCDAVAAGNIGCIMQLRQHLHLQRKNIPVYHTIELLELAYRSTEEPYQHSL